MEGVVFVAVLKALLFLISLIAIPAAGLLMVLYIMIDMARNTQIKEENNT